MASKKIVRKKPFVWEAYFNGLAISPGSLHDIYARIVEAIRCVKIASRESGAPFMCEEQGSIDMPEEAVEASKKHEGKLAHVEDYDVEDLKKLRAANLFNSQNFPKNASWQSSMEHGHSAMLLYSDEAVALLNIGAGSAGQVLLGVKCFSFCKQMTAFVRGLIGSFVPRKVEEQPDYPGPLYLLDSNPQIGWTFTHFANFGLKLERGNYTEEALKGIDAIREDLETDYPKGRIAIIHGPTGTGKSHILRDFLRIPSCCFVFVPTRLIDAMSDPSLMRSLVNQRIHHGRVVFLVEDADGVLATRHADNVSSISTLLNMGDGIFSDVMDVRFILTSNLKTSEVDPAILRKGRLSGTVFVDKLPKERANEVMKRLLGDKAGDPFATAKSLAEVYAEAAERGWARPKSEFASIRGVGLAGTIGALKGIMASQGFRPVGHAAPLPSAMPAGYSPPSVIHYDWIDLSLRPDLPRQRRLRLAANLPVSICLKLPEHIVRAVDVLRYSETGVAIRMGRQSPEHALVRGPPPCQGHQDGRVRVGSESLLRFDAGLAARRYGGSHLLVLVARHVGHDVHARPRVPYDVQTDACVRAVGKTGQLSLRDDLRLGESLLDLSLRVRVPSDSPAEQAPQQGRSSPAGCGEQNCVQLLAHLDLPSLQSLTP